MALMSQVSAGYPRVSRDCFLPGYGHFYLFVRLRTYFFHMISLLMFPTDYIIALSTAQNRCSFLFIDRVMSIWQFISPPAEVGEFLLALC